MRFRRIFLLASFFAARTAFAVDCDQLHDFTVGQTIYCDFNSGLGDGSLASLGGTPAVQAFCDGSTSGISTGITFTADFGTITGKNHVAVDTSNGYSAGQMCTLQLTDGTLSGVSQVGRVVGGFTLGASASFARLGAPAGASIAADVATRASQTSVDTVAGYVDTEVAAIQAKTDNLPASPAATSDIPSAATIAGAAWDVTLASHQTAGSTGEALGSAGGGSFPTAADIAHEIFSGTTNGPSSWTVADSAGAYFVAHQGLIVSGTRITIADPVQSSDVSIVPGTAYTGTRQPKLTWPIAASTRDLTGATVTFVVTDGDTAVFSVTGAVTSAGTESQAVEFAVTAAQSVLLTRIGADAFTYQINATWAADSPSAPVRLFEGNVDTRTKLVAGS